MSLVCEVKPTQVTLVPDAVDAITSSAGWDIKKHGKFLKGVIDKLKNEGIRTSIFIDPDISVVEAALDTGTDRIELYTEKYAKAPSHFRWQKFVRSESLSQPRVQLLLYWAS